MAIAEKQFVTFYLGEDLFCINILLVREINRNIDITTINLAPNYVRGMLNLRGQIVTVMDLGTRLGIKERPVSNSASCVVLKTTQELERSHYAEELDDITSGDVVGLFVDRIGDVVTVNKDKIDAPRVHQSGVASRFISGVVQLEGKLLITLKTSIILSTQEIAV